MLPELFSTLIYGLFNSCQAAYAHFAEEVREVVSRSESSNKEDGKEILKEDVFPNGGVLHGRYTGVVELSAFGRIALTEYPEQSLFRLQFCCLKPSSHDDHSILNRKGQGCRMCMAIDTCDQTVESRWQNESNTSIFSSQIDDFGDQQLSAFNVERNAYANGVERVPIFSGRSLVNLRSHPPSILQYCIYRQGVQMLLQY